MRKLVYSSCLTLCTFESQDVNFTDNIFFLFGKIWRQELVTLISMIFMKRRTFFSSKFQKESIQNIRKQETCGFRGRGEKKIPNPCLLLTILCRTDYANLSQKHQIELHYLIECKKNI